MSIRSGSARWLARADGLDGSISSGSPCEVPSVMGGPQMRGSRHRACRSGQIALTRQSLSTRR